MYFIKGKRTVIDRPLAFGGNRGARTLDLTDVNRTL